MKVMSNLIILNFLIILNVLKVNSVESNKKTTNNKEIYGPLTEIEINEMIEISSKLVSFVKLILSNDDNQNNNTNKESKSFLGKEQHSLKDDNFICRSCLWTFTKFHDLLKKRYGFFIIREFLAILCTLHERYSVCIAAIDLYEPMVSEAIIDHYFNAEYLCSYSIICKDNHFEYLTGENFAKELLLDKPAKKKLEPNMNSLGLKVLHVTDIHTDILYSEVK